MIQKYSTLRTTLVVLAVLAALSIPTSSDAAVAIAPVPGGVIGNTADQSTYTFTDAPIGTASADRCVIVAVHSRKAAAAATTITGVTIGGSAATILRQAQASQTSTNVAGIAALIVPSGTTATIAVTFDQTMSRAVIAIYESTGSVCTTASDTDTSTSIQDPVVNLDIPANGGSVAASVNASGGVGTHTATWTGLTEHYETLNTDGAMDTSGSSDVYAVAQTGLEIKCDWNATGQALETVGVFVSWAASGAAPLAPRGSLLLGDVGR